MKEKLKIEYKGFTMVDGASFCWHITHGTSAPRPRAMLAAHLTYSCPLFPYELSIFPYSFSTCCLISKSGSKNGIQGKRGYFIQLQQKFQQNDIPTCYKKSQKIYFKKKSGSQKSNDERLQNQNTKHITFILILQPPQGQQNQIFQCWNDNQIFQCLNSTKF